jgi:Tfp pilus assembly protein PilV
MHNQRGFALIEVVVSAALLMVVATGVMAGIDGSAAVSGRTEARTQSSSLAQQDQDRMRGMPTAQLIHYTATRTVPVAGVNYSVYSQAIWIRDANDTTSCTTPQDDNSGDYLKITSRVKAPGPEPPVQLDSLLSPPQGTAISTQGTLALQLTDQAAAPVVGQSVSITGPNNMTVVTNDAGCAVFGLVDAGTYQVTFSRTGWVDPGGVSSVVMPTSVTAGSTNLLTHSYAQAGTIHATVDTAVGGTVSASAAKALTVVNGGTPNGTVTFAAVPATGASTFDVAVYPFPTGYGVWAGGCTSGDPTVYGKPAVTATPGPGTVANAAVRQPSISPQVSGYAIPSGTHAVFTSLSAGCAEKYVSTYNSAGKLPNPGFPYGTYKLCIDFSNNWAQLDSFVNNVPAGSTPTLTIRSTSGVCP